MNIVFLSRLYYPHIGGVEKHVYELSKRLVKKGHTISIITEELPKISNGSFRYDLKGVSVHRIPVMGDSWIKKFRIWKWIWVNRKLILESDLVHCHDVFFWYLPIRILYPYKKVFTTFHGYESYPIKAKAVIYRKLFELLSHGSICIGSFMKKWYLARPTIISYGGVNIPKKKLTPMKHSAIFIGRLDDQTGIDVYSDAVRLIRKILPNFTLTVYGDGPLRSTISKDGIILKGFDLTAEEKIGQFEIAFVSRYLAILEVMAARRLVFALYDNPVKEDYLKLTPFKNWIYATNSSKELAGLVIKALKTQKIKEGKTTPAYEWVKKQTWENLTSTYLSLWEGK